MLRVTPIYGSRFSIQGEAEEPSCTLIEYGGCRVLWNVGFQESLPLLPDHDCVILTDSTLQSLGGIPMYVEQMQARNNSIPPIYATYPSVKMGQMTLYDHHAMLSMDGHTPPYTLEHVDDAFAQIQAIKYSQAMTVYGDDQKPSLQLTAHRASHVVGGAFYVCKRIQDETIVVLTSNYHVAKELHLDSCALLQHGQTPDVLVTHAGGAALRKLRALAHGSPPPVPSLLVTQLERTLQEQVLSTLRRDGNVLLPVDASGRVLELLLLLNQHWERQRLNGAYNLLWLAPMAHNTLEFARSQLEWMAASLGTEFDATTTSPFALKCVQLCSSVAEFDAIVMANQNPTCVLASGLSLEGGPARDVLLKWANNQDNAIIFTDSSQCYLRPNKNEMVVSARTQASSSDKDDDTTAQDAAAVVIPQADVMDVDSDEAAADEHDGGVVQAAVVGDALEVTSEWTASGQLLSAWAEAKLERREMEDSVTIDVKVPRRIPLAGAELKHFLAEEEMKRQKHVMEEEKQAMLREIELAKGQLHLGEQEGGAAVAESRVGASAPNARPKKKSRFDSNLFLKFSKPLHMTFEVREEPVGIGQLDTTTKLGFGESRSNEVLEDDYGIAVIPERFTDIVSGVDNAKFGASGRIGDEVTKRGLGYGVDAPGRKSMSFSSVGATGARVTDDEDEDGSDELDEQAVEAIDLSEGGGIIRGRNGRPPTKVTTISRKIEVLAEISFIPLEGRVDARAARQSVRALQPRQVVVLGGPKGNDCDETIIDEVSLLAEAAKSFVTDKKPILVPSDGETAELDVGHAAYAVRIIDAPYQTREAQSSGVEAPLSVEPFEAKLGACIVSLLDSVATGQKVALDGSIVLAPRMTASADDAPKLYLSDGEVLLTDLRAELIGAGMKAEYSAHSGFAQLVVNGKIVVKKASDLGLFDIEGPLCEDFYAVRSVICRQFVTL